MFKVDNGNDLCLDVKLPAFQLMPDLVITKKDIMMSVCNLADKLSKTPDGIPFEFLKHVASAILDFLTHLFNVSLTTTTVPSIWKLVIINPIFKKSFHSVRSNYWLIS